MIRSGVKSVLKKRKTQISMVKNNQIFSVMCQNLRSMHTGFKKLELILEASPVNKKPDCIMCQEIYKPKGTFLLDDYQPPILRSREKSNGGGVCIWIKKGLKYKVKQSAFLENVFESLAVEISLKEEKIQLLNFYRPPQSKTKDLITQIEHLLETGENIFIMGDANLDHSKMSRKKTLLDELLVNYGYQQIVENYTRPSKNPTLIDHIYAPLSKSYDVSVIPNHISDHNTVMLKIPIGTQKSQPPQGPKEYYSYKKDNVDLVKMDLHKINWPVTFRSMGVSQCVDKLEKALGTSVNMHCLKKKKKNESCWFPRPLFNLKCRLTKKLNAWQRDPLDSSKETSYKNLKARFELALKAAQIEREHRLLTEKNPSKLWNNIRKVTLTKKMEREEIDLGKPHGNEAEKFSDFFSNIATKIRKSLPSVDQDPLAYNLKHKSIFKFKQITIHDTWKIMANSNSKRSYGHDRISSKIIKLLAYELTQPMQLIINKIIKTSLFPNSWKKSDVIPLFKKGDKGDVGNYRPISLLPCLSKIAEKVIVKQINSYFEFNNLFPKTQYGFRTKKSTEHALINLTYEIELLQNKKVDYAIMLLDFSKAFDLIDHEILYKKLKLYGFCKEAVLLIKSYLENRRMRVLCNGKSSTYKDIKVGTVQGSCLGPVLFVIYTAEINNLLPQYKKIQFADDTSIIINLNQITNKQAELKNVLETLWTHFTANKLKLNMTKTEILTNCLKGNIDLKGYSIPINDGTYTTKYLGIQINSKLNWNVHLQSVMQKMKYGLIQMYRIQTKNKDIRKNLYSAMVRSHLLYGLLTWGCNLNKEQKRSLNSLIKACARCIQSVKKRTHSAPTLKKSQIFYLDDEIRIKSLTMALSLRTENNANNALHDYWMLAQLGTRSGGQLHCRFKGRSLSQHVHMYNLNREIMALDFTDKTKLEHLKLQILETYNTNCKNTACYLCNINDQK